MKKNVVCLLVMFICFSCSKNPADSENENQGKLSITSTPEGAGIILNNKYIDKKTPFVIENMPDGNYDIKLFHASYEDTLVNVVLGKNQTKELDITLISSNILMGYRIHYYDVDSVALHFQSHFLYDEIMLDSIIVIHPSLYKSRFLFHQLIQKDGFVDYPYGFNSFIDGKRGEWKFEFHFKKENSTFTKYKCYWVDKK